MKYRRFRLCCCLLQRRSREGAWIEIMVGSIGGFVGRRRSREGAWIEIKISLLLIFNYLVAPARERGLKFDFYWPSFAHLGRSREGAWIEI